MTDPINFEISNLTAEELIELIEYHNQCYWKDGSAQISDERYDQLMRELAKFDPDHPLLTAVHAVKVAAKGKVHHTIPMLSLDKAYSLEEVMQWAQKYIRTPDELLLVEPKYDGISAKFAAGILSTRGDGFDGEDISDKLPLIELETAEYTGPLQGDVRGEIIIRNDDFDTLYRNIKRKGGDTYKNSRNAVAGLMGLKDITDMLRQKAKLTLVDYDKISIPVKFSELANRWTDLVISIEELPYPTDGIVIKLADIAYRDSLGETAHHPRGQIAFKFSGIRQESVIKNIIWSFGKNNITPVAEIEKVNISGVTIQKASLHNVQNVIDHDIQVNDHVVIERAGDVIPYIVSSTPGTDRYSNIPALCPSCQTPLSRKGPELCCLNPDCFERNLQRLTAAVKSIGIENLGEPTIRKMMQILQVKNLKDIFNLSVTDILKLDNFAQKSAENLYNEISSAREVNDYQLLSALNIANIGINMAKVLLNSHALSELLHMNEEELQQLPGIGPERAKAIVKTLNSERDFIDELLTSVKIIESRNLSPQESPTVCFTGKMPEKRSYYEALAAAKGYTPTDTVTAKLSLLVAMDPEATGGKLSKAKKLEVKIISLNDFFQLPVIESSTVEAEKLDNALLSPAKLPNSSDDVPPAHQNSEEATTSELNEAEQLTLGF